MKKVRIGRDAPGYNNDYKFENKNISRDHALLELDDEGKYWLTGIGGKAGSQSRTFHMRHQIKKYERIQVTYNDDIRFGTDMDEKLDWEVVDKLFGDGYKAKDKIETLSGEDSRRIAKKPNIKTWYFALPIALLILGIATWKFSGDIGETCSYQSVTRKFEDAIGMIFSAYYIKAEISNGVWVYVGYNKDKLDGSTNTANPNYVTEIRIASEKHELYPFMATGTAFLLKHDFPDTKNGNLITNRHILNPAHGLGGSVRANSLTPAEQSTWDDITVAIQNYWSENKLPQREIQWQSEAVAIKFHQNSKNMLNVANKTYQEKIEILGKDFGKNAIPLGYSKNEEIDLAVLVCSDLNENQKMIDYKNDVETDLSKISKNQEIYCIGYPGGSTIAHDEFYGTYNAKTRQGRIDADPNSSRITYTISTIGGTSGSPVFSDDCKLSAIHFARGRQGAYGIPAKRLEKLLTREDFIRVN